MPHWVRVAELAEHPPGSAWECAVADRIVALFNVAGEVSALDGVCPHQGGPLGKGCLTGATITCPWHGWQFDVRTGQSLLSRTIRQPTYAVRIDEGGVWIDLESNAPPGD
ncbi:MAG TPA: Rieske 2Fe-2S domain-containing protein [Pirellulales bacterium]|jgi:nitrite reductase/ring-hydroxylating ferredoxin subunit